MRKFLVASHHKAATAGSLSTIAEEEKPISAGESERCATCNAPRGGPFCAACGQLVLSRRHSLRGLVVGAFRRLFDVDRGLTYTVVRLTVDPGGVVRDYLAGRTVVYVHPFIYLTLAFAAFALTFRLTGGTGGGGMERVSTAAIVFFLAAASRTVFWRSGRNYAEHLILNTFLFAHVVLLLTGAYLIADALPGSAFALEAGVSAAGVCAYMLWGYSRAFRARPALAALGGLLVLALGIGLWLLALVWVIRLVRGA